MDKLVRSSQSRARKDITQWRSALQAAESVTNPKRLQLYNIYDEMLIDAHLTHEIQKRIGRVLGAEFILTDESGASNAEALKEIQKSWFNTLMRLAMESIFWGHSLIEITDLTSEGKIGRIEMIPRRHVRPELGMIINRQSDEQGPVYRNDPTLEQWLFEFGESDNLGLINKTVPHILFKRFAQSAWSEYCEIFGMPLRIGRTNTRDDWSLDRMETMLQDMATASYAVIDKDEDIEMKESEKTDGKVYEGLMNYSSNEVSKLINGSVIGESSESGSRAKEEIGLEIQEQITAADKLWLASCINEVVIPKLINLGYPLTGLTFEFEETKDINEEWKIVDGVLQHYDVDPDYITETFGVPVIGLKQNSSGATAKGSGFFE